ncbi:MAG: hypothetical protein ABI972_00015 [Acidobacteriota bacterium]
MPVLLMADVPKRSVFTAASTSNTHSCSSNAAKVLLVCRSIHNVSASSSWWAKARRTLSSLRRQAIPNNFGKTLSPRIPVMCA